MDIDAFKLPMLGIMIASASLLAWRVNALPTWLVWVGGVEAVLLIVASGSALFPTDVLTLALYVSGVGLLIWTASVSVCCGLTSRTVRTGAVRTAQVGSSCAATISESAQSMRGQPSLTKRDLAAQERCKKPALSMRLEERRDGYVGPDLNPQGLTPQPGMHRAPLPSNK